MKYPSTWVCLLFLYNVQVQSFLHSIEHCPRNSRNPRLYVNGINKILTDQDRLESIKTSIASLIGGSLAFTPFALVEGFVVNFNGQWEFNHDSLAIMLALFGVTYRYAVRQDTNDNLKAGVVGAFVLTRALSMIQVPQECTSLPLNCGQPFYYFSISMLESGLSNFIESLIAFGGAAIVLETCFSKGIIKKFDNFQKDK